MKSTVHFAPYVPGQDGPWDAHTAAHLLRRVGFGATPEEIQQTVKKGFETTVEDLFADDREQEAAFQDTFRRIHGTLVDFEGGGQFQAWWCYRMLQTQAPLREKLTLFWHGHFATSSQKVTELPLMHQQCESLRRHAWGNFHDLVLAVSRDPAMLVWLDNEANTKEHPNENLARELMELFTLGIGNYTEKDVREAARALTGWHRDGAKFHLRAEAHDPGVKTFLGQRGHFDGTDVVDILMQQTATPRLVARKLLIFFACPEPPEEVVTEAGELFAQMRLSVKWFLRDLFQSKFFFSAACRRTRIASPVELVIGTCRSLGVRLSCQELYTSMAAMGQDLFAPPNVKGWDGEKKWINSAAWAVRGEFAKRIAALASTNGVGPRLNVGRLVPAGLADPDKVVDLLVERLLDGELAKEKRAEIARFLITAADGPKLDQFRADPAFREQQVRAALALILSLPEYHMV
ncbi:MAG TPA: DUF1800 domain-containing protein [Gemmataceae bacterium]|jgi:hypothetical protein